MLAEVEKVWILYDLDNSGELEFDEIEKYLKEMAFPHLTHSDDDLHKIFDEIDTDGSGAIDKQELYHFIKKLMEKQYDLQFKKQSSLDPNKM